MRETVLAWGLLRCWEVGFRNEDRPSCVFNRWVVGHYRLTMVLELVNVFGVGIGFVAFELELLFLTPSISWSRWTAKESGGAT